MAGVVSGEGLDPRRVQQALVAMLLDPVFAARVLGEGAVPELSARERGLLRTIDPRALCTDPHRRARAVHVLIEEFPATAAVIGVAEVDRFFGSAELRAGLFARRSMTASFAAWLRDRARGVGHIEAAMAAVRRAEPHLGRGVACRPEVRGLVLPADTLAFYLRLRDELGPDPVSALAHRRERSRPSPPVRGSECLLVERRPDGSIDLGTASEPLVRLLRFADAPCARAEVEAEAVRLGADADEARELVDELVAAGLLWSSPGEAAP
jgi:hypothetical protein